MALISFSNRFIFIKTRKTAGTSMEIFFIENCDIKMLGEFDSLQAVVRKSKITPDDYFKFGFTRNPYAIVLSRYLFQVK